MTETMANDIIEGRICQLCKVIMDDMYNGKNIDIKAWNNPPGYRRLCYDCLEDVKKDMEDASEHEEF